MSNFEFESIFLKLCDISNAETLRNTPLRTTTLHYASYVLFDISMGWKELAW